MCLGNIHIKGDYVTSFRIFQNATARGFPFASEFSYRRKFSIFILFFRSVRNTPTHKQLTARYSWVGRARGGKGLAVGGKGVP